MESLEKARRAEVLPFSDDSQPEVIFDLLVVALLVYLLSEPDRLRFKQTTSSMFRIWHE